jgi:DNA-directed RNA polymerase specialized sigma24 family protein
MAVVILEKRLVHFDVFRHNDGTFQCPERRMRLIPEVSLANAADLITGIRNGDCEARSRFRIMYSDGIQFLLGRQLGETHLQFAVEEVLVTVLDSVRQGRVRESRELDAYVLAVVRRCIAMHRSRLGVVSSMAARAPEREIGTRASEAMVGLLKSIPEREREALTRYYLYGQTEDEISTALGLVEGGFHLCKARFRTTAMKTLRQLLRRLS